MRPDSLSIEILHHTTDQVYGRLILAWIEITGDLDDDGVFAEYAVCAEDRSMFHMRGCCQQVHIDNRSCVHVAASIDPTELGPLAFAVAMSVAARRDRVLQ